MSLLDKIEKSGFFAVQSDGHLKCSCGRPLYKVSEGKYSCGFVTYDIQEKEVMIDKFGNLWLKQKDH